MDQMSEFLKNAQRLSRSKRARAVSPLHARSIARRTASLERKNSTLLRKIASGGTGASATKKSKRRGKGEE